MKRKYSYSPLKVAKNFIEECRKDRMTFSEIAIQVHSEYGLDYSEAGIKSYYYDHCEH